MRVVAGKLGSRTIKTLKGATTRPTTDKVRAAIFNRIGPYFNGGMMLDVFAGSGAMAIESLSRGMHHATCFELDRNAIALIKTNVKDLEIEDNVTLLKGDALRLIESVHGSFDLIVLDPPYHYEKLDTMLEIIVQRDLLSNEGVLICETDRNDIVETPQGLILDQDRTYGISRIRYYSKDI